MEFLGGWPAWLVWCAAAAGAVVAVGVVACILEATLDLDGR